MWAWVEAELVSPPPLLCFSPPWPAPTGPALPLCPGEGWDQLSQAHRFSRRDCSPAPMPPGPARATSPAWSWQGARAAHLRASSTMLPRQGTRAALPSAAADKRWDQLSHITPVRVGANSPAFTPLGSTFLCYPGRSRGQGLVFPSARGSEGWGHLSWQVTWRPLS